MYFGGLEEGRVVGSLTMILRTVGCRWNRCTMCGFTADSAPAGAEDIIAQFMSAMAERQPDDKVVKIYTSGSFLDPEEMPVLARDSILQSLKGSGVERLVIESRPEHVTTERVASCMSAIPTEIGIGLESADDVVRERIINKGFTFEDFRRAAKIAHDGGARVKAYLLLKPPGLSEAEGIKDAISSAIAASKHADVLSLNLCNVQRWTPLEGIWQKGGYRPPWLWSAVEVLRASPSPIICDPLASGQSRGPHNCGECDGEVSAAIRKHSLTQDASVFNALTCRCIDVWRKVLDHEKRSFGTPLV
jgi:radical SAM enzyme (TIGR01210 family)